MWSYEQIYRSVQVCVQILLFFHVKVKSPFTRLDFNASSEQSTSCVTGFGEISALGQNFSYPDYQLPRQISA